ncbi:MAG TPA: carbon starvation protein A [Gammaproteobacteria bacterium]|jgi:carbon starvation protein|nr:carbon starvation protein A [Gammaproteobacteria bacterium]HIF85975.1 carbon starvation protein A [Gammaproteobacteria bacterium]HIL64411.1 carbon starvation protein A [Porticoccaceae bacterium]HIN89203.1 carbon starvation protein A [Porticoccaceae bacterium]|tara:strand:+ start:24393 stop:26096 length:1704 start_codon:yes stop_codon:yes gene_type:complete
MSSIFIVLFGLVGFSFGWFVYSKFIAGKIYRLDPNYVTPAHQFNDGVDYVPTNKFVLWGAHFTAVAGAAPIIGPAIAVYWGWVPALLWVTFGSIFFAGVHDMGALWASNRHGAKSIGALSESIIGKRASALLMVIIFLLLVLVNAVFGTIIATDMVIFPSSVFPAWAAIPVAICIGVLIRRKHNLLLISLIGVAILYFTIYVGSVMPLELPGNIFGLGPNGNWIIILFVYAGIASMLPVWLLLQPRDYINGAQLVVGLLVLYSAVLIAMPTVSAPAFNPNLAEGTPPLFPILFVTIACGALSGFHGIVSSGTSSKQLDNEKDARFVGYLGALGEGSLALITIVVVTGSLYAANGADWDAIYSGFTSGPGQTGFIEGGARLISTGWGLPLAFSQTMLAVMVVLFAATTMDAGLRLQRYIVQEWGNIYDIKPLKNNYVSTLLAIAACLALAFGVTNGQYPGDGGMLIWPVFGATNQILASMTLMVISIYLIKLGRPVRYILMPMMFILLLALWASGWYVIEHYSTGNWVLVVIEVTVMVISIVIMLEAWSVISKLRGGEAKDEAVAADK